MSSHMSFRDIVVPENTVTLRSRDTDGRLAEQLGRHHIDFHPHRHGQIHFLPHNLHRLLTSTATLTTRFKVTAAPTPFARGTLTGNTGRQHGGKPPTVATAQAHPSHSTNLMETTYYFTVLSCMHSMGACVSASDRHKTTRISIF